MANELNFPYLPNQSMETGIYLPGWTQVGTNIAMTESPASSGHYTASVPGGVAYGQYLIVFENASAGNENVGNGLLKWDGTAEIEFFVEEVVQGSAETVDDALSRLPIIEVDTSVDIPADIAALNDISVADILTAVLGSSETVDDALSRLDNIDADVATNIPADIAALNDISVADILTSVLGSTDTVDEALSRLVTLTSLDSYIRGGREIDFAGNDANGWQRVERNDVGTEVARYNLFDNDNNRITDTVPAFLAAGKMISREVLL